MKNKYIYIALTLFASLYLFSCNEDKGNYNYVDLAEIIIKDSDKIDSLDCDPEGRIQLNPEIDYSTEGIGHDTYKYKWIYKIASKKYTDFNLFESDETSDLDVEIPANVILESYCDLYLRVINTTTGVQWQKKYYVKIKNKLQTGYLALTEKENSLELDMIASYIENKEETLVPYRNVLSFKSSEYPSEGRKPLSIATFPDGSAPMPNDLTPGKISYSVYLLTDKSTDRVNAKDYSFREEYNISKVCYIMPEFLPEVLKADKIRVGVASAAAAQIYAFIGGNWFFASRNLSTLEFIYPINRQVSSDKPFKVSPYIGTNSYGAVVFNEDENCFMVQSYTFDDLYYLNTIPLWSMSRIIDSEGDAFRFNNPDYRLVYMDNKTNNGATTDIFAIVYNTSTTDYELLTFTLKSGRVANGSRVRKIIPKDIDIRSIKHFVVDGVEPIYYLATEDRLYVALASGANMSVKDITSQLNMPAGYKISCVKNVRSFKYKARNLLTVATYNPDNIDNSGVLQFYDMNVTTGNLSLAKHPATGENQIDMKWSELGKIVDIDYKEK